MDVFNVTWGSSPYPHAKLSAVSSTRSGDSLFIMFSKIVMKCFFLLFVWSPSWMKTPTLTSLTGPGKDYGCLFTLWWYTWYQNRCSLWEFLIPWPMQTENSFCQGACYVALPVPPPNIRAPIGYSKYFYRISLLFANLPNLLPFHNLMSVFWGLFNLIEEFVCGYSLGFLE